MQKPSRFLLDRMTSYAEEGGAFLRRRRLRSRPFARVWREDGSIVASERTEPDAEQLFAAAARLLEPTSPD